MTTVPHAPLRGVMKPPNPNCAWCGGPAHEIGGRLARCEVCGAATTYPAPDEAELENAYARYRPPEGRFTGGIDVLLRRSRGALAARLDQVSPAGPVLDVGSGEGVLLDALRRRGREVAGLERAAAGPDVEAIEITEFTRRPTGWAAIVFWHSLEHLRDPAAAVDRAVELLMPGGVLAVAVPNWGSWQARVFGRRWLALDLPRHFTHLSSSALMSGLERRGLAIERVSYWRGGQVLFGWLHGLVACLPGRPDLYDALRRPSARTSPMTSTQRRAALTAGILLSPVASALALAEVAAGAGGSVYVEARKR